MLLLTLIFGTMVIMERKRNLTKVNGLKNVSESQVSLLAKMNTMNIAKLPPRKKEPTLSSLCQMYRSAGVATFHESVKKARGNYRNAHSDSILVARRYATERKLGSQSAACKEKKREYKELLKNTSDKKDNLYLSEHAVKAINRTKAVYLNKQFHKMRFEQLREKIMAAHETKVKSEINQATKNTNNRTEKNVTRLKELCDVRQKFWKEKKSRLNRTYVSLSAVEMPEVSRYAYGLPPDGQEYTFVKNPDPEKTKEKYKQLWKTTMKKASNAVNIIKTVGDSERKSTLPNIIIKKTPHKQSISKKTSLSTPNENSEALSSETNEINQSMIRIPTISPVSLSDDFDSDDSFESDFYN